jgi:Trk K+ transport system NAD-binding subunit
LGLDFLVQTWPIALALYFVRIGAIYIGSFVGGVIAREPMAHNRVRWMAFVTQAGVGLGLAREVAVEFPEWGPAFAAMIISLIVLNETTGPLFFKWVINHVGEAHGRGDFQAESGPRRVVIFGLEGQGLALGRQLQGHGWDVGIASRKASDMEGLHQSDIPITPIEQFDLATLRALGVDKAHAIVTILSDEENYSICEMAYEHCGTPTIVTRLNDQSHYERFHELGVLVVDPATAMVNVLEQFVRSPSAAALLMGLEADQEIVDLEIRNPNLHGVALHDLRLPLDILILSVHRGSQMLISHGYTTLHLGDRVTVLGSVESLNEVGLRFSA